MRNTYTTLLVTALFMGEALAAGTEEKLLLEARDYITKGESKAAVIQLKNLLKESPEHTEARLLLGEIYLNSGDGASAANEFEKARGLSAPVARWVVPLARAYLLDNQPKAVLEKISLDTQWPPQIQAQLQALRGMAQVGIGEETQAAESFKAALGVDAGTADALLGLAMLEARQQHYHLAAEYADKVLANDASNGFAWSILGEAKRLEGDNKGSLEAFNKAVALQPGDVRARLGKASTLLSLGKLDEAQQEVEVVRKKSPDMPLALYLKAAIAFQEKKYQAAEDALNKALSVAPKHAPSQLLMGAVTFEQGELESADKYLTSYLSANPLSPQATKLLGTLRLRQGRFEDALKLLKGISDQRPQDAQLLALLGSAYLRNKQFDLGTEYLSRAAELAPDTAAVRAQLGLGLIAAGKAEAGIADLKSAVEIDPNLMQADLLLVLAHIQQKKYAEAIAQAQKLKVKLADNPLPDSLLGGAYLAQGDKAKAREHWRKALTIKPDYVTANLNLAKLALSENQPEEARKEYEAILKHDPDSLPALLGLAQIAEQLKDQDGMAQWLTQARDKNPTAAQPAIMLTRYHLSQGKPVQALEVAEKAATANPNDLALQQNFGLAQLAANEIPNALTTFRRLTANSPDNPEFHHQLGQALAKANDTAGAIKEWDLALTKADGYLPALMAKAEVLLEEQRYAQVQSLIAALKSKHPQSPFGLQLEGDLWLAQKQPQKAAQAYMQAFQLAPGSLLAQRLFRARQAAGDSTAATSGLSEWLANHTNDSGAWLTLAMAQQESGQLKEAAAAYEKADALRSGNLVILNNLAWVYQELGDARALEVAEKIPLETDTNPEVMDTVAWIFVHHGKLAKALPLLQQSVLQAPHVPQIRLHLAQALIKADKKPEAKEELERLLAMHPDFPERAKAKALLKTL